MGSWFVSAAKDRDQGCRSWLSRLQECYGIVGKALSGESASVNKVGADDRFSEDVQDILGSYVPEDLHNANESRLYKWCVIDKLLMNLEMRRKTIINIFMAIEMVAAAWKVTRTLTIINCFKNSGFVTSIAEAALGSAIPQDDQEEATPGSWEELRWPDEVAEDATFTGNVRACRRGHRQDGGVR